MEGKKKAKVLSVRLPYDDYGKLFIECESCGEDFSQYIRKKLTRDTAKEDEYKKKLEKSINNLQEELKKTQEKAAGAAQRAETLGKQVEVLKNEKNGLESKLERNKAMLEEGGKMLEKTKNSLKNQEKANKELEKRILAANQHLEQKSQGFFGDELVQF